MDLEIAVPTPVKGTFTYFSETNVAPGTRVLVPFGRRKLIGVVLGEGSDAVRKKGVALKPIEAILDQNPVYNSVTLELAQWLSSYYMHPLGEVLKTMLPASSSKIVKEAFHLTQAGEVEISLKSREGIFLAHLFGKRKTLSKATVALKIKKYTGEEGQSLDELMANDMVTSSKGTSYKTRASEQEDSKLDFEVQQHLELTPLQNLAYSQILAEGIKVRGAKKPFLLHGVTGSGKTEIYLQLIAEVLNQENSGQCLMLVPEISLTPQMTHVFEKRFPNQIAVVHSAMSDTDRWKQLNSIRNGDKKILIGPRSAVFGPFQKLELLIVDEEHDNSYKQSSGLTYNGRDVAIVRAKIEGATVVLGSATPSMESFYNAKQGRYHLVSIGERVTGRSLPEVKLILTKAGSKKGVKLPKSYEGPQSVKPSVIASGPTEIPIDDEIIDALRENKKRGHQAIVLVNRRGYAYYLFSIEKKQAIQCPDCSVSMTLHSRSTILRCHYCDHKTTVEKIVNDHLGETLVAVGYGSEKAEDALKERLPECNISRLDSDAVVKRDLLPQILGKFRDGEIDILVGTQILAKGHDFPNVTLIAILEVDQLMNLPDFRAGERTFQLLVQASGRAGRAQHAGNVMIQTSKENDPLVRDALQHDFLAFAERELVFREQLNYPPFCRMISIEFNGKDARQLSQVVDRIHDWCDSYEQVEPAIFKKVKILGPSIPPIETIRGRHRRLMILSSTEVEPLRKLCRQVLHSFRKLPADIRMRVDVDPQSLI